jgi:hypothetical protein
MKNEARIPKTLRQAFRAGFSLAGAVSNLRFASWKTITGSMEIVRNSQLVLVPFKAELRFAKPRPWRARTRRGGI